MDDENAKRKSQTTLRPQKEFFEYLAREGQKRGKVEQLNKIKAEQEVEACTFQPKIIKNYRTMNLGAGSEDAHPANQQLDRPVPVYEKLTQEAKDKDLRKKDYEGSKQWRELKDCTFKP